VKQVPAHSFVKELRESPCPFRHSLPVLEPMSRVVARLDVLRPSTFTRPTWAHRHTFRIEVLAALVVGLALIPEAISFSIIAHVDPRVGLFAAFTMAVTIAIVGGRPAMISAATGSVALVVAPLARAHGLNYLLAAVILAGVIQIALGALGVARLMRFVPRSVMTGFVNALAILLLLAQLPNLRHVPWLVYPLLAFALAIMIGLPRLTKAVPAPLVAIVVLTVVTVVSHAGVPTVGDKGKLPDSFPFLGLPHVPLSLHTLGIIGIPALTMAFVGLLETLLTAKLVDQLTETGSNKTRESYGQGIANIVSGFFGGMGGCAMIGQTMINIKAGARTRLSTFLAGVFLLILVVVLSPMVAVIPMAALVAVMILVSVGTFDWHSIKPARLRRMPKTETFVTVVVVIVVVATSNLAIGVVVGVILSALFFARRVAHLTTFNSVLSPDGSERMYRIVGDLFFAATDDLTDHFDYDGDPDRVVIDLSDAHVWDASAVSALDAVTARYAARGKHAEILGLNPASAELHGNLAGHLTTSH